MNKTESELIGTMAELGLERIKEIQRLEDECKRLERGILLIQDKTVEVEIYDICEELLNPAWKEGDE